LSLLFIILSLLFSRRLLPFSLCLSARFDHLPNQFGLLLKNGSVLLQLSPLVLEQPSILNDTFAETPNLINEHFH
jgi:hypothetical protein